MTTAPLEPRCPPPSGNTEKLQKLRRREPRRLALWVEGRERGPVGPPAVPSRGSPFHPAGQEHRGTERGACQSQRAGAGARGSRPGRKARKAESGVIKEASAFHLGCRRGCRIGAGMFPRRIKIHIWGPEVWWEESGLRDHTLMVRNQLPPLLFASEL